MTDRGSKFPINMKSFAFLLVLVFAANVAGQEKPCVVKLADLPNTPELFGFRLGMTKDQVRTRVPQIVFGKADSFGVSRTSINPGFDARIDQASFSGIRTISLEFLDGKLSTLWLGYDSAFKWQTVPDYLKGISQVLKLPDDWKPWRWRAQRLRCADFYATVSFISEGPSFQIVDDNAEQTIAERRRVKEEADSDEPQAREIVGDSQAKVYYSENCPAIEEIEAKYRIVFKTSGEAEKAGYKLAPQCR